MIAATGWILASCALLLAGTPARAGARHAAASAARGRPPLPLVAGLLGALALAVVAGPVGVVLALPAGLSSVWLVRRLTLRQYKAVPDRRAVAFVVDLLATALAAGAPPEVAITAVASAVADYGSTAFRVAVQPLDRVGRLLQLGTDPAQAWTSAAAVPGYQPVAAAGRRCSHSGARLAGALSAAAEELRARHRGESVARAERIGVWALLPLGCCFLPAFVCIGVVPIVAGIGGQVLNAG